MIGLRAEGLFKVSTDYNSTIERQVASDGALTRRKNSSLQMIDSRAARGESLSYECKVAVLGPIILGVAQSSARVIVRQAGSRLFETNVPPGAFSVDRLLVNPFAGELQVTVFEGDGAKHHFSVCCTPI